MVISWLRSSSTSSGVLGSTNDIWRLEIDESAVPLGSGTSGLFSLGGALLSPKQSCRHLYERKDLELDAFLFAALVG